MCLVHITFKAEQNPTMPTTLQFTSLPALAVYSKKLLGKGFQINVQHLTLKSKLSEAGIILAQQEHQAVPVLKNTSAA